MAGVGGSPPPRSSWAVGPTHPWAVDLTGPGDVLTKPRCRGVCQGICWKPGDLNVTSHNAFDVFGVKQPFFGESNSTLVPGDVSWKPICEASLQLPGPVTAQGPGRPHCVRTVRVSWGCGLTLGSSRPRLLGWRAHPFPRR